MKTNKQTKNQNQQNSPSTLNAQQSTDQGLHRSEQSSTEKTEQAGQGRNVKPYVDYQQRDANRTLPTSEVLNRLRSELPEQYNLAEQVGKWIWITFQEIPADTIRAKLSQLGFHWNNVRKCWQHPCGQVTQRGTQDPREKYGSQFAADFQPG